MSTAPRLTIGLPVYNGEKYVAESLESLLGQSFTDFELIIADNASTDSTGDICRHYEKQDSRVRYFRQPRNIGLAPNVNFIIGRARGELYKEAAHDDLYARNLLASCVQALDEYPQVVLAHSWTAKVDGSGNVTEAYRVPADHGHLAGARALPEHAVRQRWRRRLRRHADGRPPPDRADGESSSRGPHHYRRDRAVRLVLPGPGVALLPARASRAGRSGPDATSVREHGPAPGGPMAASGCHACTGSTSGRTSARSTALRCQPRTGGNVTATWRSGWQVTNARVPPDRTSLFR